VSDNREPKKPLQQSHPSSSTALHWFRRDLRLTDNSALKAALAAHSTVVPVYIVNRWTAPHRWTGGLRQAFLCGCLAQLDASLRKRGSQLVVRHSPQVDALIALAQETRAEAIYFNRDPDLFGQSVEAELERRAALHGIVVHAVQDVAIHERDSVLSGSGQPYRVFTPYARAWMKREKPTPNGTPCTLPPVSLVASEPLPTVEFWGFQPVGTPIEPGERAARKRLDVFLTDAISEYAERRDIPSVSGTSRLSQDLRWGLLSPREVYARVASLMQEHTGAAAQRNLQTFVNELIWREFYMQVLWHNPQVLELEFQDQYRGLAWHTNPAGLQAWQDGLTGFPIVDAGMRQLRETGWMHNRVRMITAMFLTKDLHIDWRLGEQWFAQNLVDGEIASNNGGWQWSASTGTDAAPYFRIQNPWAQTARFDPDGLYIKRWLPELKDVPGDRFSTPPSPGLRYAKDYPPPILDHGQERDIALRMFQPKNSAMENAHP
jgi:deoxyribodipyrimidine photo-lyase